MNDHTSIFTRDIIYIITIIAIIIPCKVSGDVVSFKKCEDKKAPMRIILPFKNQRSANSVRRQLKELSRKIGKDIHPVHTS